MTLLSDVDGNILEDVSLLQYPAVLHEDSVHEVVTLDPREGCGEVQVLCLRNVLGEKLDCRMSSNRHCKTLGTSVADPYPQDPYVFEPPESGSSSTSCGSGFFVKITVIPTVFF